MSQVYAVDPNGVYISFRVPVLVQHGVFENNDKPL